LVDDQAIVGESVRRMLAAETDIQLHFCQDPSKAIETANAFAPTVILQDLVMPDIDGLLLVKFFRANPATRDIPMIVLSSKEEPVIKAQAFALGANDYLVKLPDRIELVARVRYHSRSYQNLLERNEAYRQLEASQRELAQEVAQAARYVLSLLPEKLTGPVSIDWRFVPSTQLGGDMFGYHWLDPDHLAIYLLDVSGHGVGSSLLAVSAANVLASQSLPSTDFQNPGQVLTRLNDVFQMEKQYNKFFTIWYGVYCKSRQSLAYSTGGHPPALLYSAAGPPQQLKADNPVIGMLPPGIDFEAQVVPVAPPARLLVYSDGVFEIERPDGSMWPFEEFLSTISALQAEDGSMLDRFHAHVQQLHGSGVLADDFSMLEARL
jgi:sigma-B regulation protein RsbU (phosphoserine phosphatase)